MSFNSEFRIPNSELVFFNCGLFRCELCGQHVWFISGDKHRSHFRHDRDDENKDCPDRIKYADREKASYAGEHELPIKLICTPGQHGYHVKFQLGLLRLPKEYNISDSVITLRTSDLERMSFSYAAAERINSEHITYLYVGDMPSEWYRLEVSNCRDDGIYKFWPRDTKGVDSSGAIFDKSSGLKLPRDADVTVGREYYLLIKGDARRNEHIKIEQLSIIGDGGNKWKLYSVSASDYSEDAAKFFWYYHCRLTDAPAELRALWPAFVESPYLLKHNSDKVFMLRIGNADVSLFPEESKPEEHNIFGDASVYEIQCSDRQQIMISAIRKSAIKRPLQYLYLWREELNGETPAQSVSVTDGAGAEVSEGEMHCLPKDRLLRIRLPFDGTIIVRSAGGSASFPAGGSASFPAGGSASFPARRIIEKRAAAAENTESISVSYGMDVTITVGLDVLWRAVFKRKQRTAAFDEQDMLNELRNAKGAVMAVPHALGSAAAALARYPMIRSWLYERIRHGTIGEQAYRHLQRMLLNGSQRPGKPAVAVLGVPVPACS